MLLYIAGLAEAFNFRIPGRRWHLFEFCDMWIVPDFIKHCLEDILTVQWTKHIPLIQPQSPAELAGDAILDALNNIPDIDTTDWMIVDFCSGSGGPVPMIEILINHGREISGKKPIPVRLSDLHPNLDAWIELAALSENLSFIPQAVDARCPPFSVMGVTIPGEYSAARAAGLVSSGKKVFRLFCLALHHFDDRAAQTVLKNTLAASDAFAIVELQERRVGSVLSMVLEFWLLLLFSMFWFWGDEVRLLLTYGLPVLPVMHWFDRTVSCLRTRTFDETIQLVEDAQRTKWAAAEPTPIRTIVKGVDEDVVLCGDWELKHSKTMHTWPLGYMSVIFGKKIHRIECSDTVVS